MNNIWVNMANVFLWERLERWLRVFSHQRIVLERNRLGKIEMCRLLF